jgi:hypothetical protein
LLVERGEWDRETETERQTNKQTDRKTLWESMTIALKYRKVLSISTLKPAYPSYPLRFIGNYAEATGGFTGDAYMALTGGTVERIDTTEQLHKPEFHQRLINALGAGAVISCSVPVGIV